MCVHPCDVTTVTGLGTLLLCVEVREGVGSVAVSMVTQSA